ncbi:MAG: class I SAM-dependent methyltransferase [Gammaproteobacteria bacterium]|nr:class I SAM-dependent methyltransferase [Gammaproteobacteria bacterium]
MTASTFKDHFSGHAAAYADARPRYPAALFAWLSTLTPQHHTAWDCGTGNGQAALGLAEHYRQVIATDPSKEQIGNAFQHQRISYRVAPAEAPGLASHSVDLVTVAQAVHWFDRPAFYQQVQAALRPGGAIGVWCYGLCSIAPAIDERLRAFYAGETEPYWPPERALIDQAYRTLAFPFREVKAPAFTMALEWSLPQFLAYLHTWSAVQKFIRQHGRDPVVSFGRELEKIWGDPRTARPVHWPLHMRVGHTTI